MTNEELVEESRRRLFLFRALFNNDENQEIQEQPRQGQCPSTTSSIEHANNKGKRRKYTRLTRIAQLDTWDCGIACLLMIAQWLRNDNDYDGARDLMESENNHKNCGGCFDIRVALERKKVLADVGTESIWTSDLMWQLQKWKTRRKTTDLWSFLSWLGATIHNSSKESTLAFVLASEQIMGADESYRDFQYYQNAFEEDQSRVASTFRDLHQQNVPMLQTMMKENFGNGGNPGKGLSLSTVIDIVEREDCLAIVLLDNNNLNNNRCEVNQPSYTGHYVILCGTSNDPKHIEIANSGEGVLYNCDKEFCFVLCNPDPSSTSAGSNYVFATPQRLEASWRAEGTDEDIIFLRKMSKF